MTPFSPPEKLIPKVIQCCLNQEPIPVYGTGENVRDWIAVEDHCEALWCILQKGRLGEVYNIAANNELTNLDLVRIICGVMDQVQPKAGGFESQVSSSSDEANQNPQLEQPRSSSSSNSVSYERLITFVADRLGHDFRYAIDSSKFHNELGWQVRRDFEASLQASVQALVAVGGRSRP